MHEFDNQFGILAYWLGVNAFFDLFTRKKKSERN